MSEISVKNIKEGMVLSSDVRFGAQVLLEIGLKINQKHIHILKSWGVNHVNIVGIENNNNDQKKTVVESEGTKAAEKELKDRFRYVDRSFAPAKSLYDNCLLHKIR